MTRRLLASYLTITALVLAILVIPLGTGFADRERTVLLTGIERDAHAVAAFVEDDLEAGRAPELGGLPADYAAGGGRIVLVDAAGISLVDTENPGSGRRDFSTRPEIAAALAGQRAQGVRRSETLDEGLMYVALPITSGGSIHGALRISYPTATLDRRVRNNWIRLAAFSAGVLAVVASAGFALARGVTRPVLQLQGVTAALSQGRLDSRADAGAGAPELRSLAESINVMAERLSRLVSSQRLFVADAAHQLRTPLTALRLRLETLQPQVAADQQPKLDAALAETARLGRLVDALLALARADAGAIAPVIVDAAAVASDRVEVWRPAALRAGIELRLDAEGPSGAVAVPGALEQILDNVIANALAAAPVGTVVTVEVAPTGPAEIRIQVSDSGPGIDPVDAEHAFEPFWRARGARPGSGFGLGLPIARRLAQAAGGSVRLTASPQGGTTVDIRLRTGSESPGFNRPLTRANPASTLGQPSPGPPPPSV